MNREPRIILFYLWFIVICLSGSITASDVEIDLDSLHTDVSKAANDSVAVEIRAVSSARLDKFYNDPGLLYREAIEVESSFIAQALNWLLERLGSFFYLPEYDGPRSLIKYAIILLAIVVAVLVLRQTYFTGLISPAQQISLEMAEHTENIHDINFETLIAEAVLQHEYRKAIRLHFLSILKSLSSSGAIDWRPEKTNRDYLSELSGHSSLDSMRNVVHAYERVWYGNRDIDDQEYQAIADQISALYRDLEVVP